MNAPTNWKSTVSLLSYNGVIDGILERHQGTPVELWESCQNGARMIEVACAIGVSEDLIIRSLRDCLAKSVVKIPDSCTDTLAAFEKVSDFLDRKVGAKEFASLVDLITAEHSREAHLAYDGPIDGMGIRYQPVSAILGVLNLVRVIGAGSSPSRIETWAAVNNAGEAFGRRDSKAHTESLRSSSILVRQVISTETIIEALVTSDNRRSRNRE